MHRLQLAASRRRAEESRRRDYEAGSSRHRRSRSGSFPIDRNVLMNWDYDDYVQQVSRGLNPIMYPGLAQTPGVGGISALQQSTRDNDQVYEERVNAFLRGIGSRRRGGRPSFSRSRSRSYSYSPVTPAPRSYSRHRPMEWHRKSSSYSRSRSNSLNNRRHSGSRDYRAEDEPDRYYRRSPARYESPPRYSSTHRSMSRSRSPRSVGPPNDYWRRQPRVPPSYAAPPEHRRQQPPPADDRPPRRREPSPRSVSSGRALLSNPRRHR
ncbi:hypothetical protein FGIG_10103 [Fasciola gigantica]|uniref:Uncharacterized protein n=1 Tax=Fasciola gigantica TaxID=46835 RepID=A0A504WSG6_FASGI|nr:hypothetical protein FGIG_10103 [Fasciola gigantica]